MNNLWIGQFGDDYTERQKENITERVYLLADALKMVLGDIHSVCEFGANVGENIKAYKELVGSGKWVMTPEFSGIEINPNCCDKLSEHTFVYNQSITKPIKEKFDLVFTRGVLIHLPKSDLTKAINNMYNCSNKYILIAEYHSPERRMIPYRGLDDALWIDDYFKPFLKKGCQIIDCGFQYESHITWALFYKGGDTDVDGNDSNGKQSIKGGDEIEKGKR